MCTCILYVNNKYKHLENLFVISIIPIFPSALYPSSTLVYTIDFDELCLTVSRYIGGVINEAR